MKIRRIVISTLVCLLVAYVVVKYQADAVSQTSDDVSWNATYNGLHLNRPTAIWKSPSSLGGPGADVLFIADTGDNEIKEFTGGSLVTIAGNGTAGYVNGSPSSAEFSYPTGIDGPGIMERGDPLHPGQASVWISLKVYDTGNNAVRSICIPENIDPYAPPPCAQATVSTISTAVTSPSHGIGVTSPSGAFYFANSGAQKVSLLDGTSVVTLAGNGTAGYVNGSLSSAEFAGPTKVSAGPGSTLFVADAGNYVIRKIDTSTDEVSTFAGSGTRGYQNGASNVAEFALPLSAVYDPNDGDVYVADALNHCIRRIDSSGNVSTYAGTDSPGDVDGTLSEARFDLPSGLLIDGNTMYVADTNNNAIRVINMSTGMVSTYIK